MDNWLRRSAGLLWVIPVLGIMPGSALMEGRSGGAIMRTAKCSPINRGSMSAMAFIVVCTFIFSASTPDFVHVSVTFDGSIDY